ncbi:MAG TPA: glycosyltransferase [Solirubrobacteraceae bacterium]|nr:glycosyltransferase [Solirubrobacteraceae bacterium]
MRALIVTNMYPSRERPAHGSFVRDQVEALRRLDDAEVELFTFAPGSAGAYGRAAQELHRAYRGQRFDVVHAHFGLTAWPALFASGRRRALTLHGTDLAHPRSRAISLAALRSYDLVATVSAALAQGIPGWAWPREVAVLPCGVDLQRFRPIPRPEARAALGLETEGPYLLFAADPARPEKRFDRAAQLAGQVRLLALKDVDPQQVPLWVNAANAVLVPSEREGFGLGVVEALACDVPVLATPVGIAPEVLPAIEGTHCGPFDLAAWGDALGPHLAARDPRVSGRARAEEFSADRMATRVLNAWRALG